MLYYTPSVRVGIFDNYHLRGIIYINTIKGRIINNMIKKIKVVTICFAALLYMFLGMIPVRAEDTSWICNYPELDDYKDDANYELYKIIFQDIWQYAFNDKDYVYPDLTTDQAINKALEPYVDGVSFPMHEILSNYFRQMYIEGYVSEETARLLGFDDEWVNSLQTQTLKNGITAQTPQYEPCDSFKVWTIADIHYRGQAGTEYEFIGDLPIHSELDIIGKCTTTETSLTGTEKNVQWYCFRDNQDRMGFVTSIGVTEDNPRNRSFSYYNYESKEQRTLNFVDEDPYVIDNMINDLLVKNKEYVEKQYSYPVSRELPDETTADGNSSDSTESVLQADTESASDIQNQSNMSGVLTIIAVLCAVICIVSFIGIIVTVKGKKK